MSTINSCKNNNDCDEDEICELQYEKDLQKGILKPKGRFCKKKKILIQNKL